MHTLLTLPIRFTNTHNLDCILTKQTFDYSFDFLGPLILGMDVPCRQMRVTESLKKHIPNCK